MKDSADRGTVGPGNHLALPEKALSGEFPQKVIKGPRPLNPAADFGALGLGAQQGSGVSSQPDPSSKRTVEVYGGLGMARALPDALQPRVRLQVLSCRRSGRQQMRSPLVEQG